MVIRIAASALLGCSEALPAGDPVGVELRLWADQLRDWAVAREAEAASTVAQMHPTPQERRATVRAV